MPAIKFIMPSSTIVAQSQVPHIVYAAPDAAKSFLSSIHTTSEQCRNRDTANQHQPVAGVETHNLAQKQTTCNRAEGSRKEEAATRASSLLVLNGHDFPAYGTAVRSRWEASKLRHQADVGAGCCRVCRAPGLNNITLA